MDPGLCGACAMHRRIVTSRGSTFFYCTRVDTDPAYVKYPRLPVLLCPGYLPMARPGTHQDTAGRGGAET